MSHSFNKFSAELISMIGVTRITEITNSKMSNKKVLSMLKFSSQLIAFQMMSD